MDTNTQSPPPATSPVPPKEVFQTIKVKPRFIESKPGNGQTVVEGEELMDFPKAMGIVINGQHVTRLDWKDRNVYFLLHGGRLRIHKADNSVSDLIVSEGDMLGKDYITL